MAHIPGLSQAFPKKKDEGKPSSIEAIYYLFWEKGISLEEFNKLPIPYIVSIVNTHMYYEEKRAEKLNDNKRRNNKS